MLRRVRSGLAPLLIGSLGLTACVEIPGFFYDVRLPRTPVNDDCTTLAHAIKARMTDLTRMELTPQGGNCGVYLDGSRVWLYIGAVRQENRINIQVRPASAKDAAEEIAGIARETFPDADVVRVHPKQGLGP